MTDITALDKLIAAVRGGELSVTTPHAGLPSHAMINLILAYRGSLDAAKALHDALLPGWVWYGGYLDKVECGFVYDVVKMPFPDVMPFKGFSSDPARAWLIAILKAYRSTCS